MVVRAAGTKTAILDLDATTPLKVTLIPPDHSGTPNGTRAKGRTETSTPYRANSRLQLSWTEVVCPGCIIQLAEVSPQLLSLSSHYSVLVDGTLVHTIEAPGVLTSPGDDSTVAPAAFFTSGRHWTIHISRKV